MTEQKINDLVELTKEKSYRMPSGLTREQRREWAKTKIIEQESSKIKGE